MRLFINFVMLILHRHYINVFGEPILLSIHRYSNCCKIVVSRSRFKPEKNPICSSSPKNLTKIYFKKYFAVLSTMLLLILFVLNSKEEYIPILLTILLLIFCYWFYMENSTCQEESLLLLDNIGGFEVHSKYGLGFRQKSVFIATNHIIINEAITMHRVIYYLVAIPSSLASSLIKSSSDYFRRARNGFNSNQTELIPLFCETLPRLDCLKEIYNVIQNHIEKRSPLTCRINSSEKALKRFGSSENCVSSVRKLKNGFKKVT